MTQSAVQSKSPSKAATHFATAVEVALILVVSASLGLIANFIAGQPLQVLRPLVSIRDSDVSLPEMIRLQQNDALVFDTRPHKKYVEGHIPGAHSAPLENFDADLERIKTLISDRSSVIVYCDTKCGSARFYATLLTNEGIETPRLFRQGIGGWQRAGLDVTEGDQP